MASEEEKKILNEISKLEKEINMLKKQQSELSDVAHRYKHTIFDRFYLFGRRVKHSKRFNSYVAKMMNRKLRMKESLKKSFFFKTIYNVLKKRDENNYLSQPEPNKVIGLLGKELNLPSITVVIPTYKPNEYLESAVDSVLLQEYDEEKITILIVVNGDNVDYFNNLKSRYLSNRKVSVVYTPTKGVSAARNYTKQFLTTEYVTYLDDDDYFTSGYLKEMAQYAGEDVSIICGRLVDLVDKWNLSTNTYINNALKSAGNKLHEDYSKIESLFSSFNMKLYRRELITEKLFDFEESVSHTEDVLFWVRNIGRIDGGIYTCKANSTEAYVRRVTEDSLSRPNDLRSFDFYINDRISLIEEFEKEIYNAENDLKHKEFVLRKINVNIQTMKNYFDALSDVEKEKARTVINLSESAFVNKALFANKNGIAFCHNFSPSVDASAFVASKRLSQIAQHVGEPIAWTVITSNMSHCRKQDTLWEEFYASYQYANKITTSTPTGFNEKSQYSWGRYVHSIAEERMSDVTYIYSRSMWAGSHVAAYLYKKEHPEVIWYAEFSDPIYMGTDNKKRKAAYNYVGEESFYNTFWKDIEDVVFQNADHIIFTNENQCQYMLMNNKQKNENEVLLKSLVWNHPVISNRYAKIIESDVQLDSNAINIGYFGTFYPNRDYDAMLTFLNNEKINVYMFTNITGELEKLSKLYPNLYIHPMIAQLEFLNLASKMDYCYLNDIAFEGEVNPYLPSKLADYLAADARIIALTYPNTPMDKLEDSRIIKVRQINDDLLHVLSKNTK